MRLLRTLLKSSIALIIALSVNGCASANRIQPYEKTSFNDKEEAVIVLATKNVTSLELVNYATINEDVPLTYLVVKSNRILNFYSYASNAYTIEAGTYYIDHIVYDDENMNFNITNAPGISEDGVVRYGAFTVKPGEMVYLGDLEFNWLRKNSPDKFVRVTGDIAQVKRSLKASRHRALATKLEKGVLLPSGTKLG